MRLGNILEYLKALPFPHCSQLNGHCPKAQWAGQDTEAKAKADAAPRQLQSTYLQGISTRSAHRTRRR